MSVSITRVGPEGVWADVVAERRQHIKDMARCRDCGASARECANLRDANTDRTAPPFFGCCLVGDLQHPRPCIHIEDIRMVDDLMKEVMAGEVRTVAEAYPPPVQGPTLPSHEWLLSQDTWWYPYRRPAVRIAEMDKPWRFNVVNVLERKATLLHGSSWRCMHDAPDELWDAFQTEDPMEWLREQPLIRALRKGLPTGGKPLRMLAIRAMHWSTCPMRLAHPAPADRCVCIRSGFKTIGATNDPKSMIANV
jgi:hypothetical protein